MKTLMNHLLVLIAWTMLAAGTAYAVIGLLIWQPVGKAWADYTGLALDSSDTPYVAYSDAANGNKASVMRFNGANWEQIGSAGFSASYIRYFSLALDSSGRPYVAYSDYVNGGKASVMKFAPAPAISSVNLTPMYQLLLTHERNTP